MTDGIYSEIRMVELDRFKVARYVVISPSSEDVVIPYMDNWAMKSGLLDCEGYQAKRIGWDFNCVTKEQQSEFGLRGYVAAYVIPEDFEPKCGGAELAYIDGDRYATLTITDPHSNSFEIIPKAYHMLFDYAKTSTMEGRIAFEEEYDADGVHYMDVYVPMG